MKWIHARLKKQNDREDSATGHGHDLEKVKTVGRYKLENYGKTLYMWAKCGKRLHRNCFGAFRTLRFWNDYHELLDWFIEC